MVNYPEVSKDSLLEKLIGRIAQAGIPDKVILFGSRARGQFRADSDYDFLVIKDMPDAHRKGYRRQIYRSLTGFGVAKDVVLATPDDIRRFGSIIGTVLKPALEEGIVVYERAA